MVCGHDRGRGNAGRRRSAPRRRARTPAAYRQINLVSDQPGTAPLTDPDLVNAWGLAASPGTNAAPGSPLWVADNGSDKATLYAGAAATVGEQGRRWS